MIIMKVLKLVHQVKESPYKIQTLTSKSRGANISTLKELNVSFKWQWKIAMEKQQQSK